MSARFGLILIKAGMGVLQISNNEND